MLTRWVRRVWTYWSNLITSIVRWIGGGARLRPGEYSYRRNLTLGGFVITALIAAPIEALLIILLVPWAWLGWLLIILSAIALVWLVGIYAAFLVRPHRITRTHLVLRHGLGIELAIPLVQVEAVAIEAWLSPDERDGLQVTPDGTTAALPVAHQTQAVITLREPVTIGEDETVSTIRFAVDAPEAFAIALHQTLTPTVVPGTR